jgi:hypothetical protein
MPLMHRAGAVVAMEATQSAHVAFFERTQHEDNRPLNVVRIATWQQPQSRITGLCDNWQLCEFYHVA